MPRIIVSFVFTRTTIRIEILGPVYERLCLIVDVSTALSRHLIPLSLSLSAAHVHLFIFSHIANMLYFTRSCACCVSFVIQMKKKKQKFTIHRQPSNFKHCNQISYAIVYFMSTAMVCLYDFMYICGDYLFAQTF